MTEQRNSRIALLAVTMLLSGAFLGLVISDNSSASEHDVVGFVNSDGVSVVVINEASGTKSSTSTAVDGSFSFNNLDSGNYMVRYSKAGYLSILDNWNIPTDLPLSGTVNMVEVASGDTNISGFVNNTDGVGISGAFVYIMNKTVTEDSWWPNVSVGYTLSAITDSNGSYSFSYLFSGNYTMRVEADGYYTKYLGINLGLSSWDISLDSHSDTNKQTIRVYDDENNPLGDASVFMYDVDTSTWTLATKYGGFSYLLKPNSGSTVYVYAYHEDYKPDVKKIDYVSGTNSFDMILGQNSASSKDVVYISSEPSKGAQSAVPSFSNKMVKLNPGPMASISSNHASLEATYVVGLGDELNLSASASTSPIGLTSYDWTGGQSTEDYSNTFLVGGTFSVVLTVFDVFGASNQSTVQVIVDGTDPVASFTSISKSNPSENGTAVNATNVDEDYTTVVFNASSSTDNSEHALTYNWDFGDGTTNTGLTVSKKFDNPGTFTVTLNVTDAAGNYNNSSTQEIKVNDLTAPSADFSFSYELDGETFNNAALEGVPTNFNASLSTDNSDGALTYNWDFGDGNSSTGEHVTHIFTEVFDEGFDVILTVTDSSNNEDIITYKIKPSLKERPDLYASSLSFSNDNPEEGDSVVFEATLKLLGMNVTESFEVGFFLDSQTGTQIGSVMVDGSNMTVGIENEFNITTTWTAVSGAHTIYVIVDHTDLIDESTEKNELSKVITVSAEDDSQDVTSIMLIVAVVLLSFGAVGYIYRDSLFNK